MLNLRTVVSGIAKVELNPCNPGLKHRRVMQWSEWWGREALGPKSFLDAMNLQLRHCKWLNNLGRSVVGNPPWSVLVEVISTGNHARQSESDFPGSSDDAGLSSALGYGERRAIRSSVPPTFCAQSTPLLMDRDEAHDKLILAERSKSKTEAREGFRIQPDCFRSHPLPLCTLSRTSRASLFLQVTF